MGNPKTVTTQIFHDNFQNYKRYGIKKAQLVIADIPHKDTPEYRMWGNGVALPCVLYVLEGIAAALRGEQN